MFSKSKQLLLTAVTLLFLGSCARIHEDLPQCEVYLEFVFDHNMEYVDSFKEQVEAVDVYVFDKNEELLFHRRAEVGELINGNRMSLADDLEPGAYKVLTVGALNDKFNVSDGNGNDASRVGTSLQDVQLALTRSSDMYSDEFRHIWFGKVIDIDYTPDAAEHKVWKVRLVRETNIFNMVLVSMDPVTRTGDTRGPADAPYTFEIITPEGAIYSWENEPAATDQTVTFKPYSLTRGDIPEELAVGHLNTCRLFDQSGYRFIVRNVKTGKVAWNYDLMTLLSHTKPSFPVLTMQEYLDREAYWNISVLHKGGSDGEEDIFLALAVKVNGWIVWLSDIGI